MTRHRNDARYEAEGGVQPDDHISSLRAANLGGGNINDAQLAAAGGGNWNDARLAELGGTNRPDAEAGAGGSGPGPGPSSAIPWEFLIHAYEFEVDGITATPLHTPASTGAGRDLTPFSNWTHFANGGPGNAPGAGETLASPGASASVSGLLSPFHPDITFRYPQNFAWSGWVEVVALTGATTFLSYENGSGDRYALRLFHGSDDEIGSGGLFRVGALMGRWNGASFPLQINTNIGLGAPGTLHHFVASFDFTQNTLGELVLWMDGVEIARAEPTRAMGFNTVDTPWNSIMRLFFNRRGSGNESNMAFYRCHLFGCAVDQTVVDALYNNGNGASVLPWIAARPAPILFDSFKQTPGGEAIVGRTPTVTPGGDWAALNVVSGSHQSGYFFCTSDRPAVVDCGVSDCVIEVRCGAVGTSAWAGALIRGVDGDNFLAVEVFDGDKFRIRKKQAGLEANIAEITGLETGQDFVIRITLDGDDITAEMPSAGATLQATDSFNNTATLHGVSAGFTSSGGRVYDIRVDGL